MFKLSSRRSLAVALMVVSGLVASPSANHSWNDFHWARQSNPFTLKLAVSTPANWHQYVIKASNDWSLSNVLDTTLILGSNDPSVCSPTSGRVEVCTAAYGTTGWLGIATVYLTAGNHITQGTVKLNETYFHMAQYNSPAWRHFVTCQEIGHTLGLGHVNENNTDPNTGSCMDYTNDPDGTVRGQLSNVSPNAHDYEQLQTIYTHLDNTTTIGSSTAADAHPAAMRDIIFATRAQWGKKVASAANGRQELFELDFGGGNKVLTFVFYAS